jgi:hypothetical protein
MNYASSAARTVDDAEVSRRLARAYSRLLQCAARRRAQRDAAEGDSYQVSPSAADIATPMDGRDDRKEAVA